MSEAVRAVALGEAIKFNAGNSQNPSEIVKTAGVFLAFLSGTAAAAKTSTAAGAEPAAKQEGKPSANTAGVNAANTAGVNAANTAGAKATKPAAKKPTEAQLAAAALEKANAEAEAEGETGQTEQTEPLEATAEGVALAVKLLIESDKRDDAISLLKKYKAASVTSMQKKPEATIEEFIGEANELLGLGSEPSVD